MCSLRDAGFRFRPRHSGANNQRRRDGAICSSGLEPALQVHHRFTEREYFRVLADVANERDALELSVPFAQRNTNTLRREVKLFHPGEAPMVALCHAHVSARKFFALDGEHVQPVDCRPIC